MSTQTGPRLAITGTCEGCCHVVDDRGVPLCGAMGAPTNALDRIAFSLRRDLRVLDGCPELPAARLAMARSICNHCGADIALDYLGLYAKPTCEKCANERTGDTTDGPLCADCGDPLADPTTADECSAAHGAGESEE